MMESAAVNEPSVVEPLKCFFFCFFLFFLLLFFLVFFFLFFFVLQASK